MSPGPPPLDQLRALPLEPLAERLGYRRDPRNRRRWKRPGSVLAIDGERFFDHARSRRPAACACPRRTPPAGRPCAATSPRNAGSTPACC